jgi:hypothetical protein
VNFSIRLSGAKELVEKRSKACHSEERSDEESAFLLNFAKSRSLASLGMTVNGIFQQASKLKHAKQKTKSQTPLDAV